MNSFMVQFRIRNEINQFKVQTNVKEPVQSSVHIDVNKLVELIQTNVNKVVYS